MELCDGRLGGRKLIVYGEVCNLDQSCMCIGNKEKILHKVTRGIRERWDGKGIVVLLC